MVEKPHAVIEDDGTKHRFLDKMTMSKMFGICGLLLDINKSIIIRIPTGKHLVRQRASIIKRKQLPTHSRHFPGAC